MYVCVFMYIINSHIKNSSNLFNKINNLNIENKS